MITPEELGGVRQTAFRDGKADRCAADHHAVDTNGRDFAGEEIFFAAEFAEEVDVSPALTAECPTLADADSRQRLGCVAEALDEILGLDRGERLIECHHQRVSDPHALHEPKFERSRREQSGHSLRAQDRCWMRIEGERDGGGSDFFRFTQGLAENRLMPEMHSIENPGGDHHRAGDFRQPFDGAEDSHHAPRKRETAGRLRTR